MKYPKINTLRLAIFQKGKMKIEEYKREDVLDFFIEKEEVFEQIRNNELTYNPSDKACKWCGNKKDYRARAEWIIGGKNDRNQIQNNKPSRIDLKAKERLHIKLLCNYISVSETKLEEQKKDTQSMSTLIK